MRDDGGKSVAAGPVVGASMAIVAVAALFLARSHALGPVDDAFISLRFAENWASGAGLAFNPGERVEGFTSFLTVMLEAIAIRLGLPAETTMTALGWVGLIGLSGVAAFLFVRLVFPGQPVAAAAATLLVSANPVLLAWASSGMESCLFACLVLLSFSQFCGATRRPRAVAAGLLLALAGLTRPEALGLVPACLLALHRQTGSRKESLRFCGAFLALFGPYFVARAVYFGHLFPNTFYAKLDWGSGPLAARGFGQVAQFLLAVPTLSIPVLISLLLLRRSPRWTGSMLLLIGTVLAVVVYEGGDHFALYRFMTPIVVPTALVAARTLRHIVAGTAGNRRRRTAAVAVVLSALAASAWTATRARVGEKGPGELARFANEVRLARMWGQLGSFLGSSAPGGSLGTIAIGAIGYRSGLRIVDPHGIIDPVIAHQDRAMGEGYAGHEKYDVNRVLSQRPDYLLILNLPTTRPLSPRELSGRVWGEFNRRLIHDPRLARSYRIETLRLGDDYWNLHVRRDLPSPAPSRAGPPGAAGPG